MMTSRHSLNHKPYNFDPLPPPPVDDAEDKAIFSLIEQMEDALFDFGEEHPQVATTLHHMLGVLVNSGV
jgi:hypothetical protein